MSGPDRRTQLLDHALNVFSRKGFNGATTKEIAAEAGVTEAIIFRHFPTKQALYQAVLESHMGSPEFQRWMADAKACMERKDDTGLFRSAVLAIIEAFRRDARVERVLLFAALEGQEQGLLHFRSSSTPVYEMLRDYILKRQRAGALRKIHPAAILAAVSGMAQRYGMLTQMFGFQPDLSSQDAVESFTSILMKGIQSK